MMMVARALGREVTLRELVIFGGTMIAGLVLYLIYLAIDGQGAPRVESRAGWTTLGMEMRLVWALDARFIEYRTWYRNPGE
jgi:hypothetical protein